MNLDYLHNQIRRTVYYKDTPDISADEVEKNRQVKRHKVEDEKVNQGRRVMNRYCIPFFINAYIHLLQVQVQVKEGDLIELALQMKTMDGLNPLVLIMADAFTPGGGFKAGMGAQEENVHRRTNCFQALEDPDRLNPVSKFVAFVLYQ